MIRKDIFMTTDFDPIEYCDLLDMIADEMIGMFNFDISRKQSIIHELKTIVMRENDFKNITDNIEDLY